MTVSNVFLHDDLYHPQSCYMEFYFINYPHGSIINLTFSIVSNSSYTYFIINIMFLIKESCISTDTTELYSICVFAYNSSYGNVFFIFFISTVKLSLLPNHIEKAFGEARTGVSSSEVFVGVRGRDEN